MAQINERRVRCLNRESKKSGPVVYWMSRDQRAHDNWALLFALETALQSKTFTAVVFCLSHRFLGATIRQYDFMIGGLKMLERSLRAKGIPFVLLTGDPTEKIPGYIQKVAAGSLVCDFDPLRIKAGWKNDVLKRVDVRVYEVDAHNMIPCWEASDKQEYSARTFRTKINRKLNLFLEEYPQPTEQKEAFVENSEPVNWDLVMRNLRVDRNVPPVSWLKPGEDEALRVLDRFIEDGLPGYSTKANDPNSSSRSDLSPYLHFGQISPARVFMEVMRSGAPEDDRDSFLEQLLVRRELADNFCFYNRYYDNVSCFPGWAAGTLKDHMEDPRPYIYSPDQLESAETHDELWNAAQAGMVSLGTMHGYMRMYWAKKILEWTRSPSEALKTAIYLNDRYELDGRDPNGYAGIAWSIGGVHDRAWNERSIFGKIRYMSYEGCRRKFNVDRYISTIRTASGSL